MKHWTIQKRVSVGCAGSSLAMIAGVFPWTPMKAIRRQSDHLAAKHLPGLYYVAS